MERHGENSTRIMKNKQKEKILIQLKKILGKNNSSIICLTGKMASGKNFVCNILCEQGFISIDLDKEVHKVILEKTELIFSTFEKIAKEKSIQIRNDDNSLNRKNLGILLFSDRTLLEKHENIIYPELTKKVLQFISDSKTNDPKQKIILNATVLFKTPKLLELCDSIFFIQSNYAKRLLRAKHRDNSSFKNIIKRFSAQKSLFLHYKNSGKPIFIIYN